MKLRNKKTGEVFESFKRGPIDLYFYPNEYKGGDDIERETYQSLAELNDEWEDYAPKEPLIKDEKIRKSIRAWADANSRDLFRVINEHFNCCKIIGYTDGGNTSCDKIEFSTTIACADKNYYYTIAELCGEEE